MTIQTESIEIRNLRLLRKGVFSGFERLSVSVGANGSGKSTFFEVFSILRP